MQGKTAIYAPNANFHIYEIYYIERDLLLSKPFSWLVFTNMTVGRFDMTIHLTDRIYTSMALTE